MLRPLILAALSLASITTAQRIDDDLLKPFTINHRAGEGSLADVSFLLEAPAGKAGFIHIEDGHLATGDGKRIRFWGVHFTDWSKGSVELPAKEDAPMWAAALARHGINMVRLHFLDLPAPRGIIDSTRTDSRGFDSAQLDRLDFEIAEFKKRGIYVDLNLNVGGSYKAGDGVQDFDKIQWAKGLTLFDARLIELQKEYAKNLLTHVNPYTGLAFKDEPAIAIVEILNENALYLGFRAPTPYYEQKLTGLYNAWLEKHRDPETLQRLREIAAVSPGEPIPRLKANEAAAAPAERYQAEMAFVMDTESAFYRDMGRYLKDDLGVKVPITGTADHSHTSSPYTMLTSLAALDVIDGHAYWQHPGSPPPINTAAVMDPLHSTVVQLSRTAIAGKPYTVSEVNHPFPNEWAAEGIPLLAAYGAFQDWDAIVLYTFEPKRDPEWKPYIGDAFDISSDPVRMTQMAAGALTFLRGDVHPAKQTVVRSYSAQQVLASRLLPKTEQPFFTPGFPRWLPLQHGVRIGSLAGEPFAPMSAPQSMVSDTGELNWTRGLVTIDSDNTQAFVGFVQTDTRKPKNLSVDLTNDFASVVLTSLDDKPISQSSRMLLSAASHVGNTGMKWNAERSKLIDQGGPPTLIEPVAGKVTLRGLSGATAVSALALDGAGHALGEAISAVKTEQDWKFPIGVAVTTWYIVSVER